MGVPARLTPRSLRCGGRQGAGPLRGGLENARP